MARIFLSHSSRDNAQAVALRDWLADNGWSRDDVFLDIDSKGGIAPGERWQRALNDAAHRCEAVLFLISRNWLASRWCLEELALAHKLNKRLFGILIDTVKLDEVPARLRDEWQLIDLESGRDGRRFDVELPDGTQGFATFSAAGLDLLRRGLVKAGLDPRFFQWPPQNEPGRPPWRGLEPMEAEDAGIFYGREAATIAALDQLRGLAEASPPRMMAVLGASGAGKSSFMLAGLIPRLQRDDRHFLVLPVVRPERAAITGTTGLVAAIEAAARAADLGWTRAKIAQAAAGGADAIGRLLTELVAAAMRGAPKGAATPTVILPLDQAEELSMAEGRAEADRLLALLAGLSKASQPDLVVLATIRTDAYDKLQSAPALADIRQLPFNLPPLARGAYQRVIEGPAERLAGTGRALKIEPALTAALLSDIEEGGAKDALPLLAFTLQRLFDDHGGDGDLTLAEYEASGRIAGAIEAAVERALAAADRDPGVPKDRAARLALLRRAMIPWLAGIDPETRTARRKVAHFADIPDEARLLVEHFVEQRLLSTDVAAATGERTIEPAHEALLRQWGLVDGWLKEDVAVLAALEGVQRAARDWEANARDDNWLAHSGGRLEDAEAITARADLARSLQTADLAYLNACRAAENDRRDRERRAQRRIVAVSLSGAIVAIVLAVVAIAFWLDSREQARIAEQQRERAEERQAEAERQADIARENESIGLASLSRVALAEGRQVESINLALAAWPRVGSEDRPTLKRTAESLAHAFPGFRERLRTDRHEGWVNSVTFSPDGMRILTTSANNDGRVATVWDASTGVEILVLRARGGGNSAAFSPDGALIVTASGGGIMRIWDAATGMELWLRQFGGDLGSVAFSPDGARIVSTTNYGTVYVWDAATGRTLIMLGGHRGVVNSAVFSPDGTRIVTASFDGTARVYEAAAGEKLMVLDGHRDRVRSAAFSPDGTRIVTASDDRTVRIWNAATGEEVMTLQQYEGYVNFAVFSPDGRHILTASQDTTARIWDAATGEEIIVLRGHDKGINSVSFSPDGTRIATASQDGTARVWDTSAGAQVTTLEGHESSVESAAFSPDGTRIVTASWDGIARVWDASTGAELLALRGHESSVESAAFSPDGTRIVTASRDTTARVWDASTGTQVVVLRGHGEDVNSAVFSPDGARIVTASEDESARVWDAATGEEILALQWRSGKILSAAFSPDGTRIVTGSYDRTAWVWDAATGAAVLALWGEGEERALLSAAFSPDGTRIVTASLDSTARVWDSLTGADVSVLRGHESTVSSAVFSPDGTRIVTASPDNTARVWDAATGAELLVLQGHEHNVNSAAFSPDGTRIVTASTDGTVRIWDISALEQGDAFQVACQRLGNNVSLDDVQQRYGLENLTPICGDNAPLPVDWRALR